MVLLYAISAMKNPKKNRTRFVVGGDRINYPGEVATSTADMLVVKILFNTVVSTRNAKFMTMEISNFYLMTPLKRPEYIRISIKDILEEIINEYQLRKIVDDKVPFTSKQIAACTVYHRPDY